MVKVKVNVNVDFGFAMVGIFGPRTERSELGGANFTNWHGFIDLHEVRWGLKTLIFY